MKTKLLLIVESNGGGVRRHVVDLIQNLDQEKYAITLLYGKERSDQAFLDVLDALKQKAACIPSEHMVREITLSKDREALQEIKAVIRDVRPDIIHCHSSKAGVLGRIAAKQLNVPKIFYTPHAYAFQSQTFSPLKKFVFVSLERWFSRHATTRTINVSSGERQCALANRLDADSKFCVIYNGISDEPLPDKLDIRRSLGLPEDTFIVGTTARLNDQKDPLTFLKIAERVLNAHPDTHFVWIGDGPLLEQAQAFIHSRSIGGHVHLLGYRSDAEYLVNAFDAYLLTSLFEGFAYSPIEALRAGIPIAATRTVGNDELILPGKNGELFEVGDVMGGAEAVERIMDAGRFDRTVIHETFLHRYSMEAMIRATEECYST